MKKILVLFLVISTFLISCKDDDDNTPSNEAKTGEITANETWTADRIYELEGKVIVNDGVTLTIEPGTIIKGRQGDELNASALIVARGGKIMAQGTAANPIIFTSILDNIQVGEKTGTNLDETDSEKWGGVIVLGKAKVSVKVGDTEGQIEGIPADAIYGKYGGTNDADNSGVISYVSIRHGGITIGDGNEINGLTLGGVGTGTSINNVEVVANLDDGIEMFGGSVSVNKALVAYQGDDAFDFDQNYSGSFTNSMVVYDSAVGDEFLEIDGPENATYATGKFTVTDCTFIDKSASAGGTVDLKSKAQGTIEDCVFTGLDKFKLSVKLDEDCTTVLTDAYNRFLSADLVVENNKTDAGMNVYTSSTDANDVDCVNPLTSEQSATDVIYNVAGNSVNVTATGANQADFDWTWTALNNKF